MIRAIKSAVAGALRKRLGVPEIPVALERLRSAGFQPHRIFDVGAYRGDFAAVCRSLWPHADIVCFEVLPERVAEIRARSDQRVQIVEKLVGDKVRADVPFYMAETASSVLPEYFSPHPSKIYPMTTIDEISRNVLPPDFIKIDVQGFEYEVLLGAKNTLPHVSAILVEVNLMDIHEGCHLLDETMTLLKGAGFVAFDICGLTRRPLDRALWQADFIFVPTGSALRADKRWDK